MKATNFIWYKSDGSTDLVNLDIEGQQDIIMHELGQGIVFDDTAPTTGLGVTEVAYRKHRTKWGNYLLPRDWELRVYKIDYSGTQWDYKDIYDLATMRLTDDAEADGVKLIGYDVYRVDFDEETLTSTYLAEAIGYVK